MSMPMERVRRWLYLFFFLSGTSALVYEIVWSRVLRVIFGSTTVAVTLIIGIFLLGLGIGSLLLGRWVDRLRHPLYLYGFLELVVALFGWLSPTYFLWLSYSPLSLVSKGFLATTYLLIPTIAMGGTLPVVVKGLARSDDNIKNIIASLYSLNTFGAIVGTILASFVLIELVGVRVTTLLAATLNLVIGLAVIGLMSRVTHPALMSTGPRSKNQPPLTSARWIVFALAFASGFIALAYEIMWFRFFQPFLGPATYTLAFILIAFLWGIASGSAASAKIRTQNYSQYLGLAFVTAAASALALILVVQLNLLRPGYWLLLLPLHTFLLGLVFPLLFAWFSPPATTVGAWSGRIYSTNILGSIVGISVTGLWLFDLLGTVRTALLLSLAATIIGAALILWDRTTLKRYLYTAFTLGSIGLLLVVSRQPLIPWLNRLPPPFSSPDVVYQAEDREAQVVAAKQGNQGTLVVNGTGTTHLTTDTKLLAHLPLLLHPQPQSVLVIGLGIGTTYRSALRHNLTVDVIEIVPAVVPALDIFFADGEKLRSERQGNIIIDDARRYVRTTPKRYDVVIIDPPPPVWSTAANLFYTQDFYQELQRILAPAGLVATWLYSGIDGEDLAIIEKTFRANFAAVSRWRAYSGSGQYLIGGDNLPNIRQPATAAIWEDLNEWIPPQLKIYDIDDIAKLRLESKIETSQPTNTQILTDDKPWIEYFILRKWLGVDVIGFIFSSGATGWHLLPQSRWRRT